MYAYTYTGYNLWSLKNWFDLRPSFSIFFLTGSLRRIVSRRIDRFLENSFFPESRCWAGDCVPSFFFFSFFFFFVFYNGNEVLPFNRSWFMRLLSTTVRSWYRNLFLCFRDEWDRDCYRFVILFLWYSKRIPISIEVYTERFWNEIWISVSEWFV